MHTTASMLDPDTFAAFRSGDEGALERLFRDRYPTLVVAASSELGDPPRAARAVERAIVTVWSARAGIASPEAFEQHFEKAKHDAVQQEKGRIAAVHRFESFEHVRSGGHAHPAPTVDEAWTKVQATLHPESPASHMAREEARHHAAHHLAEMGKSSDRGLVIVGVVVLAVVVWVAFFWLPGHRGDAALLRALASPNVRTVTTTPGQRGTVKLDDGSSVLLGADSRLVIPPGFNTRLRAVQLDGAGSFTVVPNAKPQFRVRAGRATITVTGTAFDVSAFPADSVVAVIVREGALTIHAGNRSRALKAGEAVVLDAAGVPSTPPAPALDEWFSWVGGQLTIVDRPVSRALPLLRRWYGLDIAPSDSSLLARRVSVRASLDSAGAAMRALQATGSILVENDGRHLVLRDVSPTNRKP